MKQVPTISQYLLRFPFPYPTGTEVPRDWRPCPEMDVTDGGEEIEATPSMEAEAEALSAAQIDMEC